jgi:hypothetical protein
MGWLAQAVADWLPGFGGLDAKGRYGEGGLLEGAGEGAVSLGQWFKMGCCGVRFCGWETFGPWLRVRLPLLLVL